MMNEVGPRISLFALGGTIAALPERDGHPASISLDAADLARSVPGIADIVSLHTHSFRLVPSGDLDASDIIELAGAIADAVSAGAQGIVVTQGTNTLEETAFLLDCLLDCSAPVVVTGAMRNAGSLGADGSANLSGAVRVAASPLASGIGTLVVFNDEIHSARFVRKTHSTSTGTFRSLNAGPIGWIVEGRVRIPLVPRRRTPTVRLPIGVTELPPVALVRLSLGDDGRMLRLVESAGFAGLVVEVYGAGHASQHTIGPIKSLASSMPVVFASRTGAGELHQSYAEFPGSERDMLRAGLIPAVCLDGLKSRLLLSLLLASGADRSRIGLWFAEMAE